MPNRFHSPGRSEDLPDPTVLWGLGTLTAALAAGSDDFFPEYRRLTDDSLYMEDGGGNWWRLARVEGGRFLLLGWDRTGSTDSGHRRPVDLFAEAPEWLPWPWVEQVEGERAVGFAYWWDGSWGRAPYPDGLDEDGLGIMMRRYSSLDAAVEDLADVVDQIGFSYETDEDTWPGADELSAMVRVVAVPVMAGRVGSGDLAPLAVLLKESEAGFDVDAAMAVFARAGLTEEERPLPEVPAGSGRPADRPGPWAISLNEWQHLVAPVARAARELDRPAPPETDQLKRLCGALSDLAKNHGGPVTYSATCLEMAASPLLVDDAGTRLEELRGIEGIPFDLRRTEGHPERGMWFFLRVRATADTVEVERAYDHWPEWGGRFAVGGGVPIGDVRAEMARRAPEWRPDWVWLLDDAIPLDPPADPFVRPARG